MKTCNACELMILPTTDECPYCGMPQLRPATQQEQRKVAAALRRMRGAQQGSSLSEVGRAMQFGGILVALVGVGLVLVGIYLGRIGRLPFLLMGGGLVSFAMSFSQKE